MRIAKRIYALAQEQDDPTLMIWGYNTLASTLYWSGDFETARQFAMHGVQIWRSGGESHPEDVDTPVVGCLCYKALSEWHLGEIASSDATMAESIALAKELKDMHALAVALHFAAHLAHYERDPAEAESLASELIELSTLQNFAFWLAAGESFAVGRAAFPVTQPKASLGSRTEYETIGQPVRCWAWHISWH